MSRDNQTQPAEPFRTKPVNRRHSGRAKPSNLGQVSDTARLCLAVVPETALLVFAEPILFQLNLMFDKHLKKELAMIANWRGIKNLLRNWFLFHSNVS